MSGSEIVFVLDRPVSVGRKPSLPRASGADVSPRLVRVLSPRAEVSATHLESRQLDSPVVTDPKSTNCSVLVFPGREARSLARGESIVATPHTLIDISDGNVIEILPLWQVE